mmetsp:Transcript_13789/g.24496  ORF Transcript_13789/g.24496 Transcript_13789/m.24496 type:complete len:1364 (+) Transcript_13789:343-4434(+)|eukprot:CAMPEP_0203758262 /NCGR_PEP_ID=MMETSP0098-20131031/11029_1 /ASSEMBLY_ACC=CAM_ASM_000208 /TAXON_ID=96639 /ORGANISM=" , Strain NY0313808BC1" /LENGTH=1363 /DNA_ID=CAMNT_0050650587 /DNA_START=299 /DNA_END=4390 /DNA_ORIENTATION=+
MWGDKTKAHPFERANVFSRLTLHWLQGLISKGSKRPLEFSDLPAAPDDVRAEAVGNRLKSCWTAHVESTNVWNNKHPKKKPRKPSFFKTLMICFYREWLQAGVGMMVYVTGQVLVPMIVQALLTALNEPETYINNRFMGITTPTGLLFALIFALLLTAFGASIGFLLLSYLGAQIRAAIMFVIFQKSLRLSPTVQGAGSNGEIINLMSNDSERIFFALVTSHMLWISPVLIFVVMIVLSVEVGLSALAGMSLTLIIIPIQIQVGKRGGIEKRRMLQVTDNRVNVTSEALSGINVVKMNNWEPQMANRIQELREKEMKLGRNVLYLFTMNNWLLTIAPSLIAIFIFSVYSLSSGKELTMITVFTVLAFLNIIRFPLMIMPRAVAALSQAVVSTGRIREFLELGEIGENGTKVLADASEDVIRFDNVSLTWDEVGKSEQCKPVLRDVSFNCRRGELVALIGKVGSGKTSLVSAMIGEIGILDGSANVRPSNSNNRMANYISIRTGEDDAGSSGERQTDSGIAYVSQDPWIQNARLKEVITFQCAGSITSLQNGETDASTIDIEPIDEELFERIIEATELGPDIAILPNGLDTEIGDRGVNLSGGQRARCAIARALYRTLHHDLDLIILDDCFSALDPHVGLKFFSSVLLELLRDRTRIVVLNSQLHLLEHFDRIIALENGTILVNSTTKEALKSAHLQEFLSVVETSSSKAAKKKEEAIDRFQDTASNATMVTMEEEIFISVERSVEGSVLGEKSEPAEEEPCAVLPSKVLPVQDATDAKRLYQKENRERGRVQFGVYQVWFNVAVRHGCRLFVFLLLLAMFTGGQICIVGGEYWLTVWAREEYSTKTGLGVYGIIVGGLVVFILLRGLIFMSVAVKAAINLHNELIYNILRAPVNTFFDITPAGRILNRFSNDLDKVDQFLPETFFNFCANFFQLSGTFIICIAASPYFLLFVLPILVLFGYIGTYFGKTSRELKRLESVSRSPLYSNFGETLSGIATIRAFNLQNELNEKNKMLVDNNSKAFLLFWMAARWLALRLDLLIALLQTCVALLAILLDGKINANLMGLAVVYSMQLSGLLQFTVRLSVETENAFTSVERLRHYARNIPQEKEAYIPEAMVANWPSNGTIVFENVTMRYRSTLPLVLRGASFTITGGEKIGICGRTGAGKSSLMATIFRLVDPLERGRILIDGIDISTLGLADLRRQLSIIPQQPVLFSGTLRFNLDPWSKRKDEELIDVLERVRLGYLAKEDGLDMVLRDKGSNLSFGERGLLAIARALLRDSKIVLMDEATANIDTHSDSIIQETMRKEFIGTTTLTIAHRIKTIIDSDKVLVMGYGEVLEYDHPQTLISDPESAFAALVKESNM